MHRVCAEPCLWLSLGRRRFTAFDEALQSRGSVDAWWKGRTVADAPLPDGVCPRAVFRRLYRAESVAVLAERVRYFRDLLDNRYKFREQCIGIVTRAPISTRSVQRICFVVETPDGIIIAGRWFDGGWFSVHVYGSQAFVFLAPSRKVVMNKPPMPTGKTTEQVKVLFVSRLCKYNIEALKFV
eukprot:TRINITY_DN621_c0_g1_i1.p1 TRINITY_DN621_c0_g1~~TRINITY_DN621_c0_g1_i1.p1  ORF type:complete len:212 (+),score=9.41 TRINITY_DN621_c0_g1_i1:90-638(+)